MNPIPTGPMQVPPDLVPATPAHTINPPDMADPIIERQRKEDVRKEIEQDMKRMRGFVRVYTCGECGKRVNPARGANGEPVMGTCPHCKRDTYTRDRTMYVGHEAKRTDPRLKLNDSLFAQGAQHTGMVRVKSARVPQ